MASSACTVCGSTHSKVVDGLMYCEDFREVEEDEDQAATGFERIKTKKVKKIQDKSIAKSDVALGLATGQATTSKKRKGDDLRHLYLPKDVRDEKQKASRLRKDITTGREHAPSYLRSVGKRLAAFTKILAKGVAWLKQDPAIPENLTVGLATGQATTSKKRKGDDLRHLYLPKDVRDEKQKASRLRKDITTGREHAPSYLRSVGKRLAAFTKILAKGVAWLKQDPAIPENLTDHTFAIYQRYLSACNVAFTLNDYTEDLEAMFRALDHTFAIYQRYLSACNVAFTLNDYTEDLEVMFRALVINKNAAFEKAREKKAKIEQRKKKGKEILQKSVTAWDLLMSDTLNENLELRSDAELSEDDEQNEETAGTTAAPKRPQTVTVVDTTIPKEVLENASTIYLAMDVVVAILYVSVVTIGCRWIILSDIIRWVREDRMGIALFQRVVLEYGGVQGGKRSNCGSFPNMDDEQNEETAGTTTAPKRPQTVTVVDTTIPKEVLENDLPLYEFQRTALFIWQICHLPPTPVKIDFKQIVARCLYHLNLPEAMFERVMVLLKIAPPCKRLDEENLRRQGRIEQIVARCLYHLNLPEAMFERVMVLLKIAPPCKRLDEDSLRRQGRIEQTKVFAFILMALKLSFGLDDKKEIALSKKAGKNENMFSFMEWFYQLKMRIMFWEGYDPVDILQTWKPVQPLFYDNEFPREDNMRL
ncbi:unnamed protein product [Strongylus vulgaris]|uniref:Uncharacterized protein n=1 Tax=Strongylus vulgaris TaxID=40348 RepID=A0A3P7JDP3_STRVU|nr:unnamed protein product [Strongylus vulgaris]